MLSTPSLVQMYSIALAVARHALTQRSKGQRPRSHGYENFHGRTVASDACCYAVAGVDLHVDTTACVIGVHCVLINMRLRYQNDDLSDVCNA